MKNYTREEFTKACFKAMDNLRDVMEDKGLSNHAVFGITLSIMPYISELTDILFTEEVDIITIDKEN